jgi:hypothetical protein
MANYIIIGGDGKEYGPISTDDLRTWISEGRVNTQTMAKAESDAEFRPLSTFPELAHLFAPAPAATPRALSAASPAGAGRESALNAIKVPAIALIVIASLGIAYYLFNTIMILTGVNSFQPQMPSDMPPEARQLMEFSKGAHGPLAIFVSLVIMALNGFVLFGSIKMLKLQNYGVAVAAAIIAMLPCQCCCLFGLPFGIWALVVLNKPEVKSNFN